MKWNYKSINILGLAVLITGYVLFTIIFCFAFFNNGIIVININKYDEALVEFISQLIFIPFVVYYIWKSIIDLRKLEW